MKHIILILMMMAALTGCNPSGSSSASSQDPIAGTVAIDCVSVSNTAGPCATSLSGVVAKFTGITIINAGIVSRGTLITVSMDAVNNTEADWNGYYSIIFDAGCNGAETWEFASMYPTPVIAPGETWNRSVGGACGDMALGERTLTATLYEVDASTVVDQVQVQFTLTE